MGFSLSTLPPTIFTIVRYIFLWRSCKGWLWPQGFGFPLQLAWWHLQFCFFPHLHCFMALPHTSVLNQYELSSLIRKTDISNNKQSSSWLLSLYDARIGGALWPIVAIFRWWFTCLWDTWFYILVGIVECCKNSKFRTQMPMHNVSKHEKDWKVPYFRAKSIPKVCYFVFHAIYTSCPKEFKHAVKVKNTNFSIRHCLVCPTYKESLNIGIITNDKVIKNSILFGLLSALHQHVYNIFN